VNFVRETSDKGPINTWDRQCYLQPNVPDPTAPAVPRQTRSRKNFFFDNYASIMALDHDDGSNNFNGSFNLLMYSGSKNYLGWNKHVHNSLFVRPDESDFGRRWTHCNGNAGLNSTWINNTCITEIDV
jgi:hypothetical protein